MRPRAKRAAARHLLDTLDVSARFACRVVGQARSTFKVPHPDQFPVDGDAGLRTVAVRARQCPSAVGLPPRPRRCAG